MKKGGKPMRMHFRVKHFDRTVGIFVILALAVFIVTLVFIGRGQRWFEKRYHYTVVFNKVQGLKPGTGVTISGMEVGAVKSLRLNPQNKVELTLEVLETYKNYIRKDSQATIASSLLGGKTVEIIVGSPNQTPLPEGANIVSQEPKELTDILKEIDVKAPLKKLDETLENVRSIAEKLNDPKGELFTLLKNVEFVTAQLKNGQGNVGAILQDKKIHGQITGTVAAIRRSAANLEEITQKASKVSQDLPQLFSEVDRAVKEVPKILEDVKRTTSDLPKVMGDVKKAAGDAPAITENVKEITKDVKVITGNVKKAAPEIPDFLATTHESVAEAEKLIQGLENHWLLRGSMPKVQKDTSLAISQRESPYEKGGKTLR
jgi:phospholipid/cholesterol/gamma-HCH transport system substrate-binding protein